MIRQGTPYFLLEANFVKHGIEQQLRMYYSGKERKIVYNATTYTSSLALLGILQGVVVHPDDASVVKGSPTARRHMIDLQLAQTDPLYVHHLTRYDRAMRQRNHLLRARTPTAIDSWEYEMAHSASYVVQQRAKVVQELQQEGMSLYHQICGGTEKLSLFYKAHGTGNHIPAEAVDLRNMFCDQYQRHRQREMELGATLTGPHKDDVTISLNDKEARSFASEGQQRSCVIALRLAEWERLKKVADDTPLMLVDDIGMSLDGVRRASLLKYLDRLEQVFVTTTEERLFVDGEHLIDL